MWQYLIDKYYNFKSREWVYIPPTLRLDYERNIMINQYLFKEGLTCCYCDDGIVSKEYVQVGFSPNINCKRCDGSGEVLLSSQCGFLSDCDCLKPCGRPQLMLSCGVCGHFERDMDRARLALRARAYVRLLMIKKDQRLIDHLESQFKDGMSWENRSEWHIDHIKPIKAFLDEGVTDVSEMNDIKNLQPLWAKDNLSKGAKWNGK